MPNHYDSNTNEFSDRRKNDGNYEKLSNDFSSLQENVKNNLDDYGKRLEGFMMHSDAIQKQVQDSLQRQLDQNNEQHREMVSVFKEQNRISNEQTKEQLSFFINSSKTAIEDIIQKQEKEDIERNARHTHCEDRLTLLETTPIKNSAETWKSVKVIFVTTLATAIVMGCAIFTKDFIENTTKVKIPMEVKQ